MQSTLAVTAMPQVADVETKSKVGMILGLIGLLVVIGGGTAAFVFFGKKTDDTKLNGNANSVAVVTNANTSRSVFPAGNSNVPGGAGSGSAGNQAVNQNVNSEGNINQAGNQNGNANVNRPSNVNSGSLAVDNTDTDGDKLPNRIETYLQTDALKSDTDGDTFLDGNELALGYSPLNTSRVTSAYFQEYCAAYALKEVETASWTEAARAALCQTASVEAEKVFTSAAAQVTAAKAAGFTALSTWCESQFPGTALDATSQQIRCMGVTMDLWGMFMQPTS